MTNEVHDLDDLIDLAEKGDAIAQNLLAARLATGFGVARDTLGSVYWYAQAAAQGYAHAMWNLGSMLVDGEPGLPADRELGLDLIRRAAEGGESSACLFLSHSHESGTYGNKRDLNLAHEFERRAWDRNARKEFVTACDVSSLFTPDLGRPRIVRRVV